MPIFGPKNEGGNNRPVEKNDQQKKYLRKVNAAERRRKQEIRAQEVKENLDEEVDERFAQELEEAKRYAEEQDVSVGTILVNKAGRIITTTELDDETRMIYGERNREVVKKMLQRAKEEENVPQEKIDDILKRVENL